MCIFVAVATSKPGILTANNTIRSGDMATGIPGYKVILHGDYGVGKSSVFRRFLNNSFTSATGKQSTIGLDQCTRVFSIGAQSVKLTLWDTGGVERMSFLGSSYYRGAQAALLVYSLANKETFSVLSQFILDIVMNAEGAKIFLCGNMADMVTAEQELNQVTEGDLEQFMSQCENVLSGVYRVSCKDNTGLDDMFTDMARVLHRESKSRLTLRRDLLRPGDNSKDLANSEKRSCC